MLTPDEQRMLTYALDEAQDDIWTKDGFTESDQDALTSLRRLTTGPTAERRVYAWAQTIDTADSGATIHIPGTHHNGSGPETSAIVVRREDMPVLAAMLTEAPTATNPETVSPAYARLQAATKEAAENAHLHAMRGMRAVYQLCRQYGFGDELIPASEVLAALGLDENANTVEPAAGMQPQEERRG